MAEVQYTDNNISSGLGNYFDRRFKQAGREQDRQQREQDRRLEQYARQQRQVRLDEIKRQAQSDAVALNKEYGMAHGDPAKIAELDARRRELSAKFDEDMRAADDLEQYKSGYTRQTEGEQQDKTDSTTRQTEGEQQDKTDSTTQQSGNAQQDKTDATGQDTGYWRDAGAVNSLSNYFASKAPGGAAQAPNVDHLRAQADMHDIQAGNEQKNQQANFREANRNWRNEAEKTAVSQSHMQNEQRVKESEAVDSASALLNRGVGQADYDSYRNYAAEQRDKGVANQREMWGAKQTAEEERADADKENYDYREHDLYNNMSGALSMGGVPNGGASAQRQSPPATGNGQTQEQETNDTSQTEQVPESRLVSGAAQVLMNYVQGSPKDRDKYGTPEIQALIKQYGLQPLAPNERTFDERADAIVAKRYPQFLQDYNSAMKDAGFDRNVGAENQRNYSGGNGQADALWGKDAAGMSYMSEDTQKNITNGVNTRF